MVLDGHTPLGGFRKSAQFRTFLGPIGPFVQNIEELQHYEGTDVVGTGSATSSLYAWAGGHEAFEKLFVHFYEAVLADELLYPLFKDMDPEHPQRVARRIGEVFGGPDVYSQRHGGHPEMLQHQLKREIREDQRRRWVDLLVTAADEVGLPDDPEFRVSFMGYIEWGTRLANVFSQPDATPNLEEPVPLWGWAKPPWVEGS